MSTPMSKIYDRVFTVLKSDAGFLQLVPEANIRPSTDPSQPVPGNVVIYWWDQEGWDMRARRGTGLLRFIVGAVDNKLVARSIMDKLRELLNARSLSNNEVTVHLFREAGLANDTGMQDGYHQMTTAFNVKLIGI